MIGKYILNVNSILSYMIDAYGTLPWGDKDKTEEIKFGIRGFIGLLGFILILTEIKFITSYLSFGSLLLLSVGNIFWLVPFIWIELFNRNMIKERTNPIIEKGKKIANLFIGIGLIIQMFIG